VKAAAASGVPQRRRVARAGAAIRMRERPRRTDPLQWPDDFLP
jgi:hypothetical protein